MTIATPTNLRLVANTDTTISIAWGAVVGAASYEVHNLNNDVLLATVAGATTAWTDVGLNPNTGHNYYVRAVSATGEKSALPSGQVAGEMLFTKTAYDKTPPTKPTAFAAVYDAASGAVKLSWGASTDDWSPVPVTPDNRFEITYKVYRFAAGVFDVIVAVKNPATTALDVAPVRGVAATYSVLAQDFYGNASALSNNAVVTVPATPPPPPPPPPDTTPPAAPTGLAVAARSAAVTLTWTPVAAVDLVGYQVRRNGTVIGTPTGTTYTDSAVPLGVPVSYTVEAVDKAGNVSPASASVTV